MLQIPGIDVSAYNGTIDWKKAADSGVRFAMIRAGYGGSLLQKDEQADANLKGAIDAGIDVGAYWFSYALSEEEAREEARLLIEVVKAYRLTYPLCFDFEEASAEYAKEKGVTIDRQTVTAFARAFCDELRKNGWYPANYANKDYLTHYYDQSALADIDLWYAHYANELDRTDVDLWQYTDAGDVPGISGHVDMDYALKDFPKIIRENGYNGFTKPKPENPHWAEGAYEFLHDKFGFVLYDENLDRTVTMGELLEVLARLNGYENPPAKEPSEETIKETV